MTLNEMHQQKEQEFNLFLEAIGLVKNGEPLVQFDSVQNDYNDHLNGELLLSAKKITAILSKNLSQKPHKKHTGYSKVNSFKLKGKGWIVLEKFDDFSCMTLINKWW